MAYSKLNNNLKNYKFKKTNYYNNNKLSLNGYKSITSGSYGTIYNTDSNNNNNYVIKEITGKHVYTKKIKNIKNIKNIKT